MMVEAETAPPADDDVKRRVRFDAEADLRLLLAVVKREPYAADHGTKLKAWDQVADEVYATAAKLRDVPSSRRAVTDRFHHLLLRYEQGTLKLKRWTDTPDGEEKAALVQNLFRQISARLAEIRNKKSSTSKRAPTSGRSSISSLPELASESRKRSASSLGDDDENSGDDAALAKDEAPLKAAVDNESPRPAKKLYLSDTDFRQQLLALKREKLALKREKLALLREQHEERMALERQRLELASRARAPDTSATL